MPPPRRGKHPIRRKPSRTPRRGRVRGARSAGARAEAATRTRRELDRLVEVGRRLAQVLNPEELYQTIFEQMGQLMDTRNMFICLYDEDRHQLDFPFYFEDGQRLPRKERPLSHGLTDHVLRTRAALLIQRDYERATRALGIEPFGQPAECWMGVPMIAEGRILGVIALWSREAEGVYDQRLLHLVQTFANQAAIAVRNAQLYEELHEREETYRSVVETASRAGEGVAIARPRGDRTALAYVNDEFVRITGYSRDELEKLGMEDLVPPEQLPAVLGLDRRGTPHGKRHEAVIVAKDGHHVSIEVSASQTTLDGAMATVCFVRDITERQRAERELLELKNFNQDIVQATPVGIAYLDHRGVITYENPALMEIMGVEGAVSPAMHMNIFDHPSVRADPDIVGLLKGVLRGDAFPETALPFEALTGKRVEIAVSGVPVFRAGSIAGAVLLVRDVTDFRRYEAQLVEQRNFNRNIVENAPIGIAYLDAQGFTTYENPHLLRLLGHRQGQELRGRDQRVTDLPSLKGKGGFRERIDALLRGVPFRDLTMPYRSLFGRDLVVTVNGVPLLEGDQVKGAVLLIEDVTEKLTLEKQLKDYAERLEQRVEARTQELRNANRELEEAKRSLETILASTADGIAALDPHGHLIFHNAKVAELLGTQELQGKTLAEFLHTASPARGEEVRRALADLVRGQPVRSLEVDFLNGRGEQLHVVLSALPIVQEGRTTGAVATLTDISDRKRLEDELRRYSQSLEREVERRTARLVQSAKMAALGQLVAGVAHEINNPLSYVKSNTETLLEACDELHRGPLAKALQEAERSGPGGEGGLAELMRSEGLKFMMEEAPSLLAGNMRGLERISQIVLQLRNFASPQMGRLQLTDLNATMRDTVAIFSPQFRDRIAIVERYGALPKVRCDPGQITQVVMNLLVNAGQAIKGHGTVQITTRRQGPWVEVEVRDDGPGIPPDVLPKIWDPFFTTKEKGNTGLGLSISYNIVREHNGEIAVETEVGKGTAFTVRLPGGEDHA